MSSSSDVNSDPNRNRKRSQRWLHRKIYRALGAGLEIIGKPARGKTCEAIQGILAEAEEIMDEFKATVALDGGLIVRRSCQAL